ncbi:MAG TPA: PAS domain S-box protein [Bryobacteraceae bacterium]|nr:PAS domain S-box protein [Bryobacteraceae bacterium]
MPGTVLCVDNNETNRYARSRLLRSEGFEIIDAASGADALRLAAEKQPSLVLTEIELPDINGFAVCRRLKANPQTAAIPVLHISSLGKLEHEYPESLESGAQAYLQLPVEPPVLIAMITALIRAASAGAASLDVERAALDSAALFPEQNPSPVLRIGGDGTLLYANPSSKVLISEWKCEHGQRVPNHLQKAVEEVMAQGAPAELDIRVGERDFSFLVAPIAGSQYANLYGRDVTQRKRLADQLRERVEELETVMEVAPVAIWVAHDPECRTITGNRMADLFYEAGAGENVSANVSAVRRFFQGGRELQPRELPMQEAALQGTDIRNSELDVLLPSGRRMHMLGHASPLRNAAGQIRGCVGAFLDITERKQAEEALRESEERFSILADGCPAIIWVSDADGGNRFVNRTYREFFGVTYEQVEGRKWQPYIHPADERAYVGEVLRAVRERVPIRAEARIRRADGEWRWISSYGEPRFSPGGEFIGHAGTSLDITERKRAEEALRESEIRYRTLFDSIDEGYCIVEVIFDDNEKPIDYRFLEVNQWFEKHTGLIGAKGKRMRELAQGHEEQWFEIYGRIASTGQPARFESRAEQLHRWYDVYAYRFGSPEKRQVAVLFNNITERKLAEQARRESEERFRRLVEVSAQIVWATNAQGKAEIDSPSWRAFTGRTLQQWLGWNWLDAIHPDERPRVADAWRHAVSTATPYHSEYRQLSARGEYRHIASQAAPIFKPDGTVREWVGMSTDITDRKQAEHALAEAMQRLDAHMDNSPLAVIEFDPQFRVTRWSKEAKRIFGWSAEEILGRAIAEMPWVHEADIEAVRRVSQEMLDGTHPRNLSMNRNYRKDGSLVDCEWYNSALYDSDHKLVSIFSQVLDVTDRKRTEERLRQAQKMESIALLAGGVAHDFNNLLVAVIGNASLASEMLPPGSPAEELLDRIVKSGEQAAHLTKQMLAYSGKGRFVIEPVNLSDVVREVTDLVRSTAPKKIAMQLDFEPGLPPIEADRGQIHQVLMNLVINATEAIGNETGLIAVQTSVATVDEQFTRGLDGWDIMPGKYVCLEVRDTGCGMDEATKAKIFDPFFTTKFQGRGLGLAAVGGIVRGHKGAIRVRTAPGRGTSFLLLFPATRPQPAVRATALRPRAEQDLHPGGAILVVDDEESVRNVAKLALERRGCTVLLASSGFEALSVLRQNGDKVAIVILDLSMPGMSGEEVLPKLLAVNSRLDVVISSGYAEADALRLFEGMPIAGFIQKPYTIQRLVAQVKAVIEHRDN